MQLAHLNQDAGVSPGQAKGAAVHVEAMRRAFAQLGAAVLAVDEKDPRKAGRILRERHGRAPLDLVYERYALDADAGADFAREHGVPLVLEVNAPLLDEAREHRGRMIRAEDLERERAVFASAARVLAVSRGVARYVMRHGIAAERVLVRPNAVDSRRFAPLPPAEREHVRAGLGLQGCFVLGFHGRLRPWHGFERIARAVAGLRRSGVPAHLLAVGAGEFQALLERELPAESFTVVPWVDHGSVARLIACFDVLPLAYDADAPCYFSPLKLLEAMAVGAVPVVPSLGDLPEAVRHGIDGLVYGAGDDSAFQDALARLAASRELRAALASEAVKTARGRSWNALAYEVMGFALERSPGR
jgi:glycosyltransferase involved in cell wall biosynthesis